MKHYLKITKLILAFALSLVLAIGSVFSTTATQNVYAKSKKTKVTKTTEVDKKTLKIYTVYAEKMKSLNTSFKLAKKNKLPQTGLAKELLGMQKLQKYLTTLDKTAKAQIKLVYSITDLNKDNVPELIVGATSGKGYFCVLSVYKYYKKKCKDIGVHPKTDFGDYFDSGIRICKNGAILYEENSYNTFKRLVYSGDRIIGLSCEYTDIIEIYTISKTAKPKLVTKLSCSHELIRNNSGFEEYTFGQTKKGTEFKPISQSVYKKYLKKYGKDMTIEYFNYDKTAPKALKKGKASYRGQKHWKLTTSSIDL